MEQYRRRIWIFLGVFGAGILFTLLFLSVNGNQPQIYTDVVNEYTAMDASNKTAERILIYILSIGGAVLYLILRLLFDRRDRRMISDTVTERRMNFSATMLLVMLPVVSVMFYFLYASVNPILVAADLFAIYIMATDRERVTAALTVLFLSVYAIIAGYRIYVFFGGTKSLSLVVTSLIALILSFAVSYLKGDRDVHFRRSILLLQIPIPGLLLIYLSSRYIYGDESVVLSVPSRIRFTICLFIVLFVAEAVGRARQLWNEADRGKGLLCYGSCISVMAFHRFSGSGVVVPNDLWHPFDNILAYSQIVELGQRAFSEYIPLSGLYSVVQGFFLAFFGQNQFAYYYVTQNLMMLFSIIMIVGILRWQLKDEYLLLAVLLLMINDYNRALFLLPISLLLACPQIINRRNLWLKLWFLTSFFHTLYYPVYGAAVCLGYLPMGIWQIAAYARSGKLGIDIRTVGFWARWLLCCVPVILGLPLLFGTVGHTRAMSSQTVFANGIARFGQTVPSSFLPYIESLTLRLAAYDIVSFVFPAGIVWISVALFARLCGLTVKSGGPRLEGDMMSACSALSIGIELLVIFSFSIIRLDIYSIYARTEPIIRTALIMILFYIGKYMRDDPARMPIWIYMLAVVSVISGSAFLHLQSNLKVAKWELKKRL